MDNQMLILGSFLICAALFGIAYCAVALKVTKRAAKSDPAKIRERHESGIFITHGMVRSNPGERGLERDKKLSDYYYDSLVK